MNITHLITSITVGFGLSLAAFTPANAASACDYNRYERVICAYETGKQLSYYENGRRVMLLEARYGQGKVTTKHGTFSVKKLQKASKKPWIIKLSNGKTISYSANFAKVGYKKGSMSANIELRDAVSAKQLHDSVTAGTPVIVF